MQSLTSIDIYDVATDVVETLKALNLECCFIGGMACSLYGLDRLPKDIDVLINNPHSGWDQEFVKRQLVARNSRFYLVQAKTPGATYKVLWYRLPPTAGSRLNNQRIKIDILLPGLMDLPAVPTPNITWFRESTSNRTWPAAPYDLLLMTKLQAWFQRRESSVQHYRDRVPADHADLVELLIIGRSTNERVYPVEEEAKQYLSDSFIEVTKQRVIEHVWDHPDCLYSWKALGFTGIGLDNVARRSDASI